MKKTFGRFIIVFGFMVAAATAFAAYSKRQPTFHVFGVEALTTTASDDIVAVARYETHQALAKWTMDKDGHPQDPSFKESGRSWSTNSRPEGSPKSTLGRGNTTFIDKDGHHIEMEFITSRDSPMLVFLSNDGGPEAQKDLLNAFLISLQKQGVKAHFD